MAEKRRTDRLAQQLRTELAAIIDADLDDPRVGVITLAHVRLSSDLSHATAYVHSVEEQRQRSDQLAALNSAKGFLRRRLSSRLAHLRRIPELHFEFDRSIEAGLRVEELLSRIELSDESEAQ